MWKVWKDFNASKHSYFGWLGLSVFCNELKIDRLLYIRCLGIMYDGSILSFDRLTMLMVVRRREQ